MFWSPSSSPWTDNSRDDPSLRLGSDRKLLVLSFFRESRKSSSEDDGLSRLLGSGASNDASSIYRADALDMRRPRGCIGGRPSGSRTSSRLRSSFSSLESKWSSEPSSLPLSSVSSDNTLSDLFISIASRRASSVAFSIRSDVVVSWLSATTFSSIGEVSSSSI